MAFNAIADPTPQDLNHPNLNLIMIVYGTYFVSFLFSMSGVVASIYLFSQLNELPTERLEEYLVKWGDTLQSLRLAS